MRVNRLTSAAVGLILNRAASHVRAWKTGYHPMPEQMMRLLELELERRARVPSATHEETAAAQP